MERKLAAILSADIAGFSRLTALDEEATLGTLGNYQRIVSELVSEHGGRVFGGAGDSIVAEFASAVQAVRCAVAIQRSLFRHNSDLDRDRRLEFRIGVNLGDVVASGDDLLGDGVNVAARLQEIAEPGGVCLSGSIREQILGKVNFGLVHLGERSLKNIPRPVSAYRVDWAAEDPVTTGVLGGQLALPDKPSIVVLPFANMSGDPEQDYFADGIAEDIITALSRHRWFFVIARNSAFTYKGRAVDIKQVARELGVRYVLEGSVRRSGSRIRVTGQLIDAETSAHLWAERYDRPYEDIFAIQDEITENVVGAIEPEMLMGEGRRVVAQRKTDPGAFDCCMRGIWHHFQVDRDEFTEAEKWLRRAIAIDPKFARAHMTLARVLFGRCLFGWSKNIAADRDEVRARAERAVALDDRDPYCHYAVFAGSILSAQLPTALSAAQRAIDLNPNFASGHLALGWTRIYMGYFEESLDPLLRALRLSPNDPIGFLFTSRIALAHYHMENFAEALHFAEQALAKRRVLFAVALAAACLVRLDQLGDARPLVAEIEREQPADTHLYWEIVNPYANRADREHLYEALRQAGLNL